MPEGPSRRRLSRAARQIQLLDIAEALFIERGFANVTMEDIARAAGVSRPIPYDHFGTKEGVFVACVTRARDEFDARLGELVSGADDPISGIRAGAEAFFSALEDSPGRWRLLFGGDAVLPGEFSAALADLRMRSIATLEQQVRSIVTESASDIEVQVFAHAMSGAGERLGHWWIAHPETDRQTLVDLYVRFVFTGLDPLLAHGGDAPSS